MQNNQPKFCPECGARLVRNRSVSVNPLEDAIWLECPTIRNDFSMFLGTEKRKSKYDMSTGKRLGN